MSISFAPARCRDWSFHVLGGEGHVLCAVPAVALPEASSRRLARSGQNTAALIHKNLARTFNRAGLAESGGFGERLPKRKVTLHWR